MGRLEPAFLLLQYALLQPARERQGAFTADGRLAGSGAPCGGDSGSVRILIRMVHGTCWERKRRVQDGETYVSWFLAQLQQGAVGM